MFVCDDFNNKLKRGEDTRRGKDRDEALSALRTLYEVATPSENELATAIKLMKASVRITAIIIAQCKAGP